MKQFVEEVRSAFLTKNENFEDSFANDEFFQKSLWLRLDNQRFFIRHGKKIEVIDTSSKTEIFNSTNTELEVYRIPFATKDELLTAIEEVAKTFYDIGNKSYLFKVLQSPVQVFNSYLKEDKLQFMMAEFDNESIETVVSIYQEEDNALFMSLGDGLLMVYFFTFFPNDDF